MVTKITPVLCLVSGRQSFSSDSRDVGVLQHAVALILDSFMSLVGVQLDFFTSFSRKPFQLIGIAGLALSLLPLARLMEGSSRA